MIRHFRKISCVLLLTTQMGNATAQKEIAALPAANDNSYGYTAANPVKLKKGNVEKSILHTMDYLAGLVTADNQALVLIKRSSVPAPGRSAAVSERFGQAKSGILDKYVFVTATSKDTITLFVDIYNRSKTKIPAGLKYVQP